MRNAKELRDELYRNYDQESTTGIFGFILEKGHRRLERKFKNLPECSSKLVLEFGGGRNPHYNWIPLFSCVDEYHIVDFVDSKLDSFQSSKIRFHSIEKFNFSNEFEGYFDRIIACHVLEHISNPFEEILKWVTMLKPGGTISLLLPNDPGLLWGIARWLYKKKLKFNGWGDLREYDLAVALEHVNSVQNLLRIAKFLGIDFVTEIKFWPFRLKVTELNLQTIVHITKPNSLDTR
jgi:SAM-dependent methyltransferase